MVSVLIPWRPLVEARERLRLWVEQRWHLFAPDAEICYGQGPEYGPFNRSAALNEAFQKSSGSVVIVADADTSFDYDSVSVAIEVAEAASRWVLPYDVYYNLLPLETSVMLTQPPSSKFREPAKWQHRLTDSVSGVVVVPRAAFEAVGGFDERFRNWGGEDRAFAASLDVLWSPMYRVPGAVMHLWHPEGLRFQNPDWPANQALEAQYLAAKTAHEMRAVRFGS